MNPFGSVAVHVWPPSNEAFTAHPSLKFQSLAPVIRLLGLSGLTAIGVSFWAVVSRLTSTATTAGPRARVAKAGPTAVGAGASGQATRPSPGANNWARLTIRVIAYLPHADGSEKLNPSVGP